VGIDESSTSSKRLIHTNIVCSKTMRIISKANTHNFINNQIMMKQVSQKWDFASWPTATTTTTNLEEPSRRRCDSGDSFFSPFKQKNISWSPKASIDTSTSPPNASTKKSKKMGLLQRSMLTRKTSLMNIFDTVSSLLIKPEETTATTKTTTTTTRTIFRMSKINDDETDLSNSDDSVQVDTTAGREGSDDPKVRSYQRRFAVYQALVKGCDQEPLEDWISTPKYQLKFIEQRITGKVAPIDKNSKSKCSSKRSSAREVTSSLRRKERLSSRRSMESGSLRVGSRRRHNSEVAPVPDKKKQDSRQGGGHRSRSTDPLPRHTTGRMSTSRRSSRRSSRLSLSEHVTMRTNSTNEIRAGPFAF